MLKFYSLRRALSLWLVAVVCLAARPAAALDCAWIDGNSTWSNASSWSCGVVPGAGDNVTINTFVTITLDADATVGVFNLSNGLLDGAGTLTITGPFVWGDGGKMDGTGTTIAQGGTTITGQVNVRLGRPLELASDTFWESNNITILPGGSIVNRSGRTFTDNAQPLSQSHAISVPGGTPANELPTITNRGRWIHAGAGTGVAVNFVNEGTLISSGDGLGFVNGQVGMSNIAVLRGTSLLDVGGTGGAVGLAQPGSTQPGLETAAESVGRLSVKGNFAMTNEHDLQINLVGPTPETGYDQLAVEDGDVTVDGRLYLTFADGFVPTVGQRFDVLVHTGNGAVSGCYDAGDIVVSPEEYEVTVVCTSEGIAAEVIGVTAGEPGRPVEAELSASAYPNPVSRSAGREVTLAYTTAALGPVRVEVYDLLGRSVATVFDGPQAAGAQHVAWYVGDVPAGLYFVRITTGEQTDTQRLTIVN